MPLKTCNMSNYKDAPYPLWTLFCVGDIVHYRTFSFKTDSAEDFISKTLARLQSEINQITELHKQGSISVIAVNFDIPYSKPEPTVIQLHPLIEPISKQCSRDFMWDFSFTSLDVYSVNVFIGVSTIPK